MKKEMKVKVTIEIDDDDAKLCGEACGFLAGEACSYCALYHEVDCLTETDSLRAWRCAECIDQSQGSSLPSAAPQSSPSPASKSSE
jgi:hypothetical protein